MRRWVPVLNWPGVPPASVRVVGVLLVAVLMSGCTAGDRRSTPSVTVSSAGGVGDVSVDTVDIALPATLPLGWSGGAAMNEDLAGRQYVAIYPVAWPGSFDAAGAVVTFSETTLMVSYGCYRIGPVGYRFGLGSSLEVDATPLVVDDGGCTSDAERVSLAQFRFLPELFAVRPVVMANRDRPDGLTRLRVQSGETFLDLVQVPSGRGDVRLLLGAAGWTVAGATESTPSTSGVPAGLWSVEYDGPEIHHGDGSWTVIRVLITGYDVAPQLLAEALAPFGYTFGADAQAGVGALVAAPVQGMAGAVIVPMEGGSASIISHGSSSSELVSLLPDLGAVPVARWIAATAAATTN